MVLGSWFLVLLRFHPFLERWSVVLRSCALALLRIRLLGEAFGQKIFYNGGNRSLEGGDRHGRR